MFRRSKILRTGLATAGLFTAATGTRLAYIKATTGAVAKDKFTQHLVDQQKKHPIRGMAEPFVDEEMLPFLKKHKEFAHLVPDENSEKKATLETPIEFVDISQCPVNLAPSNAILGAGGFTGLISTAYLAEEAKTADVPIVVISNQQGPRVGDSWAGVIELDTDAEQYTGMHPSTFLFNQAKRLFSPEKMSEIQKTGSPKDWRSLDLVGFLMAGPVVSLNAAWLALQFEYMQRTTDRAAATEKLASELKLSKKMYEQLNARLDNKLFVGKDSLMIARTEEEVADLKNLQTYLAKENVNLQLLSGEQVEARYGMKFNGKGFAIKPDYIMAANHPQILTEYLTKQGAAVHDAVITRIYVDQQSKHRVAEYKTHDGKVHHIAFEKMFGSFGNQKVVGLDGKPLFNLVRGQGVSALARIRYPVEATLPADTFPGGISRRLIPLAPAQVVKVDGVEMKEQLVRFTADACVMAPDQKDSARYLDPNHALGVVVAIQSVLGPKAKVDIIKMEGCSRPVSIKGEVITATPAPGIKVAGGQGGGGGTRAMNALLQEDVQETTSFRFR